MRAQGIALLIVVAVARIAAAQPNEPLRKHQLAVDKCGHKDPALTEDDLRRRGAEHYLRGETLYLQGDYVGAVSEFVSSYCLIPYYSILKDIGQAFERNLDYENAISYLERYTEELPADARRTNQCAADPQEDKKNVQRRVRVLKDLRAHIAVQTNPEGARIEITGDHPVSAAVSGQRSAEDMTAEGGAYTMTVSLDGYETETKQIRVQIGKPYTFFFNLRRKKGRILVQTTPADARIFLDDRLVGIGRFEQELDAKDYIITTERQGRMTERHKVQINAGQVVPVRVDMPVTPQFGRRQLIVFSGFAGGAATGALLFAFDETLISSVGVFVGAGAALVGTYLWLDDSVSLGTSNLTITSTLASSVAGTFGALLFTDNPQIVQPVGGAATVIGAGIGYYLGDRTKIRPGDAALINSSMTWGVVAGGLFAASFEPPREIAAGLVLSGLAMGGLGGSIMTRYFDISRTHALLIDIGGIVGILGGLAAAGIVYPPAQGAARFSDEQVEHFANFSLGGMALGLITAGILTRNLDAPKLNFKPTLGNVPTSGGKSTMTVGFAGSW